MKKPPKQWVREKLALLIEEYREGHGYGDIYESQFLCYLECWMVLEKYDAERMWELWKDRIRTKMSDPTAEVLPMNQTLGEINREDLIQELLAFQNQMVVAPPLTKVSTPQPEESGILDMFQGDAP